MSLVPFSSLFDWLAQAAAPIAVAGLWQGVGIALAMGVSLKLTRGVSAAHRFALWFAGFFAITATPLLPLVLRALVASNGPAGANTSLTPLATTSSHALLQFNARWAFVLAAFWLIASVARATDLAFHIVRLHRLWKSATPVEVATLLPAPTRDFQVFTTQELDRPSVIGFFAPRILIPDWLLPRLTAGELEQIVLHESTHLNRRDDWSNLF